MQTTLRRYNGLGTNIDQQRQETPDTEPIYDTEAEVKQEPFTKEELNEAISRPRNNKTPRPNRVTSELIKLSSGEAREKLRELLNMLGRRRTLRRNEPS